MLVSEKAIAKAEKLSAWKKIGISRGKKLKAICKIIVEKTPKKASQKLELIKLVLAKKTGWCMGIEL